ncbi:sun protein [Thermosinus carboxydivorans Nor1]|uniref:16S rRNA (cytosine(967)-C(5))-methyltransferase n=1 Tax=Thermosinus carboxydivorans Nor1 TaxID=401526 RepID=A1HMX4_9FIRM|nr:16S rRNA (cytosine(967)-C(5))-methyltransferase RsmB [Thermosinus carboxydivorans]EAX48606.1 sun protein [Thermosinus carboxydivorans Nor1]
MNAREVALKVINRVDIDGAYANIALAQEMSQRDLTDRDRRFITELVYGTVKAGATLDWILSHYSSRPLDKIHPVIRNILRMGIYQIFFLSRIPVSAACNEAVKLAQKYGHAGTVKFVNAVLRSAGRSPDKVVYPDRERDPEKYIALRYFHPEWLVRRWVARFGAAICERLCEANNETPPLSLRTNTLKTSRADLLRRLAGEGVVCEPSAWAPEGILCHEYPALSKLASLRAGLFQVQDESSMTVAHVLSPRPGDFVIDACGAPGGKSTHIAALMGNKGKVLATDIYEHKLALMRDNAVRLGISILETQLLDAVKLGELYPGQADRVLVDAPCSGLGVLRRKPDSRWRKNEQMLTDLPRLQLAILASAAKCLKPGGILVYSTCTTEPEENGEVVKSFLATNPEFILEPAGRYLPVGRQEEMVQLWPHADGVDGFFIARMVRRG